MNVHRILISITTIVAVALNLLYSADADAAKRKRQAVQETVVHIPIEVIDLLKVSDIDGAIRNMRMEAASPRSQYILRQMQAVKESKSKKISGKDYRGLFNTGVAYHNLYLFLKGYGIDNRDFFKEALKYYRRASRTVSPNRKNSILLTTAALYAAGGEAKKAERLFKKVKPDLFKDEFRKYETMSLYYAAIGDPANAIENLKLTYDINPEYTRFWLGISDDFTQIASDENFQAQLKVWRVKPLTRGPATYSSENDKIVQ